MAVLPAEFAELELFAEWSLATERERYAKRLASTMDEMQAFYDAAFPRLADALMYLDQFDLAANPSVRAFEHRALPCHHGAQRMRTVVDPSRRESAMLTSR